MTVVLGCESPPERPTIQLTCASPVAQRDVRCGCDFGEGRIDSVDVRYRGNSSLQYPKKSLRLKSDGVQSLCGLPAHAVWVLNANYIDKSFLRHKLSFDLFRAMGAHNLAPNGCYREVYRNGEYEGLYLVHERIDEDRCGILSQQPGGVVLKEPPVFTAGRALLAPDEHPWGQKFPDTAAWDASALMTEMHAFIHNSSDSAFAAQYADWFHRDNFADWLLLLLLTNNTDGLYRNFYLYRLHEGAPFRVAIWDYDETYGRYGDNRLNNIETEVNWRNHALFERLMAQPAFRQLVKERWKKHRDNALSLEVIFSRMDRYASELDVVLGRNFDRWPANGPGYTDQFIAASETDLIRSFIKNRLKVLDQRITNW